MWKIYNITDTRIMSKVDTHIDQSILRQWRKCTDSPTKNERDINKYSILNQLIDTI